MSYETENTMLVQLVYNENDRVDKIIKLPKKLIIICDLFKGNSQFILYNNESIDIDNEKDLKYLILSVTNDPYSSYAGGLNNLGYFRLLWVIGDGVVSNTKPLIYLTNNNSTIQISENIPLRIPTKFKGNRGIRFLQENYNSYQIVEYTFGEDLTQDINIKYSIWDYKINECECLEKDINLFSAYNRCETKTYFKDNNMNRMYKFHNFKKNNV